MRKELFIGLSVLAVLLAHGFFVHYGNVEARGKRSLKGTAYISSHGGHIAVIDLATMKPPMDVKKDRIIITEAGSEMEGAVAGRELEEVKRQGGSYGAAQVGDKLFVGLLNGTVVAYDLKTGKKSEPMAVGKKFCDAVVGPDGNIYFTDMADGHVYVWDSKSMKTEEKIPVGAAVCGIAWTKNAKKAYVSGMPRGIVYVLDWKTRKVIKEIKDPEMTSLHQIKMAPDKRHLWVSAPNEFDPGMKPPTHKSQIVVIDTRKDEVVEHIVLPDDVRSHDFEWSPDGKTVLLASRIHANDSELVVMDYKSRKIIQRVSACSGCHNENEVEATIDKGSPLRCGVTVDWKKAEAPGY